jgi:hypothetical protein
MRERIEEEKKEKDKPISSLQCPFCSVWNLKSTVVSIAL